MGRQLHVLAWLGCAGLAFAQDGLDTAPGHARSAPNQAQLSSGVTDVVHSNVSGLPSALVPGGGGLEFKAGGASTSAFDRPFGSPSGLLALTGFAETGSTTNDEILLVNGTLVGREGDPAPWTGGADNFGPLDTRIDINDAGQFAFATNVAPATTTDDYIIRGEPGGTFTIIAQEGGAIPALPGTTYGSGLDTVNLLTDGRVGFEADLIAGATTTTNNLMVLDTLLLAQNGVTVPAGQAGGATETWENFDLDHFWITDDGAHYLIMGDLTGATASDDVLVYDGVVVLQEDSIIPGSGFAEPIDSLGIVGSFLDHGGNWYARGNNDITEQDWVVRNGVVIATLGQPIVTGSLEVWDDTDFGDCFFLHVGNSVGDWVIGGVTNAASIANGVLVKNGTDVVCRENDPVDLDGNGLFDDDAFISTFGNDDAVLLDDGTLYFVATLRNGAGTSFAQIVARVATAGGVTAYCNGDGSGTLCPCGNNNDGSNGISGCANSAGAGGATLTASGSPSISAGNLVLSGSTLQPGQAGLYLQGNNATGGGNGTAFGDGLRCAGGGVVRLQIRNSGMLGASSTTVDVAATGGVTAGDVKRYQLWFRDTAGPCGSGFNFTNGIEVTWAP